VDDVDWMLVFGLTAVGTGFAIVGGLAIGAVVQSHRRDRAIRRELDREELPAVIDRLWPDDGRGGLGMTDEELLLDPWAFGPWCWVIDRVRLFDLPIPCRGMNGLWPVPTEALANALGDLVDPLEGRAIGWDALTLQQPYATAIALGHKRVENRPWRRSIPPHGRWIGLHAGTTFYAPPDWFQPFNGPDGCGRTRAEQAQEWVELQLDSWRACYDNDCHWPDAPTAGELPRGVMLGAVHVAAILRYPDDPDGIGNEP
jgi:hypothetical protein